MKQCKPCITIRDITKIILSNIKLTYKNIKNDIKSYRNINATVCALDRPVSKTHIEYELDAVKKIRKQAQENYAKEAHTTNE